MCNNIFEACMDCPHRIGYTCDIGGECDNYNFQQASPAKTCVTIHMTSSQIDSLIEELTYMTNFKEDVAIINVDSTQYVIMRKD